MTGQMYKDLDRMMKNVVHELGHAYDNALGIRSNDSDAFLDRDVMRPNLCDRCYNWQQHPPSMDANGNVSYEKFGDMFIAWTYNAWNLNPDVSKDVGRAQAWMNGLVHQP